MSWYLIEKSKARIEAVQQIWERPKSSLIYWEIKITFGVMFCPNKARPIDQGKQHFFSHVKELINSFRDIYSSSSCVASFKRHGGPRKHDV